MRLYRLYALTTSGSIEVVFYAPESLPKDSSPVLLKTIWTQPEDDESVKSIILNAGKSFCYSSPAYTEQQASVLHIGLRHLNWVTATDVPPEILHHPEIPESEIISGWQWQVATVTPDSLLSLTQEMLDYAKPVKAEPYQLPRAVRYTILGVFAGLIVYYFFLR